jgi:hypothetical protein
MSDSPLSMNKRHSMRLYWVLQLGGWGLYTFIRIDAAVAALNLPLIRTTFELVLLGAAGVGLSHGLRAYMKRHRWAKLSIPRLAWRLVAAGFVLGVPLAFLTQLMDLAQLQNITPELRAYAPGLISFMLPIQLLLEIFNNAVLLLIWQIVYFATVGIRERNLAELRQSETARALQLAELRLLKTQLNPHFLFNALNAIRSLIADDPSRAQGAVTHLANTLRYTLSAGHTELVSLAQELEIVVEYLQLESMRFEERLQLEYRVSSDAGTVQIPVMMLQTVVENAIKHGIAQLPLGGLLKITGAVIGAELRLEVQNPRAPAPPSAGRREGIGLHNAEQRLRLLFGARASLKLDFSQPDSVTARIRIPRSP